MRVTACAVGQAAAALFLDAVGGRDRRAIELSRDAIAEWLSGEGERPEWPGLENIEAARAYPARHGAVLLAWNAALAALPK
ncbi:hypothetical protein [Tsuneonella deserti]|uniref:hypothetical protein n=1 Tax=Tsuneonella deserti TaxID=2035528 RepID=UPI001E34F052|nr:hypothetical protein [Tsuneonella deserti]